MSSTDLNDQKVRISILVFLFNKGRWGENYFPLQTMTNWLGKRIKNDGKRLKSCIKDLANEDYIIFHKGHNTVSLNPRLSMEIRKLVEAAPDEAK